MAKRAHVSGSYDPLTWMLGGLLDLLFIGVERALGKPVESLIKRLPHR
jgi:hypothetical protein